MPCMNSTDGSRQRPRLRWLNPLGEWGAREGPNMVRTYESCASGPRQAPAVCCSKSWGSYTSSPRRRTGLRARGRDSTQCSRKRATIRSSILAIVYGSRVCVAGIIHRRRSAAMTSQVRRSLFVRVNRPDTLIRSHARENTAQLFHRSNCFLPVFSQSRALKGVTGPPTVEIDRARLA